MEEEDGEDEFNGEKNASASTSATNGNGNKEAAGLAVETLWDKFTRKKIRKLARLQQARRPLRRLPRHALLARACAFIPPDALAPRQKSVRGLVQRWTVWHRLHVPRL